MVAGWSYLSCNISRLFFGNDDTLVAGKKSAAGEGDTVQVGIFIAYLKQGLDFY